MQNTAHCPGTVRTYGPADTLFQSKRDLGFIEGDLIECLNAGDGSWWVGRLYRDRRSVGSFPSNFVEVLPSDFRPTTRTVSPLPGSHNTPSPKNTPAKSKTFRKPFEAYAKAPHYTTAKQPEVFREEPKPKPRANSARSFANSRREDSFRAPSPAPPPVHDRVSRAPSPMPAHDYSRSPSPMPNHDYTTRAPSPMPHHEYAPRAPSPMPPHNYSRAPSPMPAHDYARAPSPAPTHHAPPPPQHYRAPSPAPSFSHRDFSFDVGGQGEDSPPPPAPPPHRHAARNDTGEFKDTRYDLSRHDSNGSYAPYNPFVLSRNNSNASYQDQGALSRQDSHASYQRPYDSHYAAGHQTPRAPSPSPHQPSPGGSHMTPSPLREAMDGVMEQLGELGGFGGREGREGRESPSPDAPFDPWSPESFNMVGQSKHKASDRIRPLTSMGIANSDEGYETWSGGSSQVNSQQHSQQSGERKASDELPQLDSYVQRMEGRFQKLHRQNSTPSEDVFTDDPPPPPPPKGQPFERPKSSMGSRRGGDEETKSHKLRTRKSAYDIAKGVTRTYTTKTNSTEQSHTSSSTQSSARTLWSGVSASGFSSTSAGSMARNQQRTQSAFGNREPDMERPETPFTGVTYHSSHASDFQAHGRSQSQVQGDLGEGLGGLVQPKAPKRNIFKKIFESAKTGVANSRGSIAAGSLGSMDTLAKSSTLSRSVGAGTSPMTGIGNPHLARDTAREMGLGNGVDWVQVRRDVNRSNSLSRIERTERKERCQMLDHPTLNPVDELYEGVEGDEGADGMPVHESMNYLAINLSQVDKGSRFVSGLPPMTTSITLATTYVCRPYRSDFQRLRAIFTWVAEKICWEEDFEGEIDTRQVIQTKRACAEEYAVLVMEMCKAVGIPCEIVRGYLKSPGSVPDLNMMPRSNHWWNAVLIDNEWRMIDCCLASPSNPRRGDYSSAANNVADFWWFLARPLELCWTHVPEHHDQQHIVPPVAHETLLNLPCTCPPYFRQGIEMVDYNTCMNRIEDLEMVHIKFNVPADIEIAAEVEARAYSRDSDGDLFESGDLLKKRALAQAEWFNGFKRYTVKALLPGDEGQGVLKIYAGKRGLMHSIKDIPHPLAFTLPIVHTGENPPYDFVTRHPTPHAQRHDIYVVQPQCQRLALNNTFVFAIRQHPSSTSAGPNSPLTPSSNPGGASPVPFMRPGSAMSMNASTSGAGSCPSSATGVVAGKKPAKLAIQTPGGKILRLMRKEDRKGISVGSKGLNVDEDISDGGTWETIIKCSEKGVWRGLVLADRTARWCVFAEWVCVG